MFRIEGMVDAGNAAIGFDAGDNSRGVAVTPDAILDSFGFVNMFRIDGTYVYAHDLTVTTVIRTSPTITCCCSVYRELYN